MSFFHNLNKRLADLATKQDQQTIAESKTAEAVAQSPLTQALNESDYSAKRAAAGKDIGKPGKMFGKIAKGAAERYGSKAAGERVAGAVLNKLRTKESVDEADDHKEMKLVRDLRAKGLNDKQIRTELEKIKSGTSKHMPKEDMDESALQAYIGDKKYGKNGMDALRKAGRDGASKEKMSKIRDRYNKMDEAEMDEGNEFSGELVKARAQHKKEFEVDGKTYPVKESGYHEEMDEGYAEMDAWLKSREAEKGTGKFDKKERTMPGGMKATTYTRKPEPESDEEVSTEPKKKGRPAGTRRAIGAKGPTRKSKLAYGDMEEDLDSDSVMMTRPSNMSSEGAADDSALKSAIALLKKNGYNISKKEEVAEKVKAKKTPGGKPDFLDLDKDGDKTEPMKKSAKEKISSKKEVEETTTSGSVATATAAPKAGKGMQFGKGVYEGFNNKVENMIAEGMSINISVDEQGKKSISVNATEQDAEALADLLKNAGLAGQSQETCSACGGSDCGCAEVVDENSPDYPTNVETSNDALQYSGGINGPKSTGQTTVPVVASQERRLHSESVELERSLFKTWTNYKGE